MMPQTTKEQKQAAKETLEYLKKKFPKVFNYNDPLPLKVGIDKDIVERDSSFSKENVRLAIGMFTFNQAYQAAIISKKARFDLDGNKVEEVSEKHLESAGQSLKGLEKKFGPKTKRNNNTKPKRKPQTELASTNKQKPKLSMASLKKQSETEKA